MWVRNSSQNLRVAHKWIKNSFMWGIENLNTYSVFGYLGFAGGGGGKEKEEDPLIASDPTSSVLGWVVSP